LADEAGGDQGPDDRDEVRSNGAGFTFNEGLLAFALIVQGQHVAGEGLHGAELRLRKFCADGIVGSIRAEGLGDTGAIGRGRDGARELGGVPDVAQGLGVVEGVPVAKPLGERVHGFRDLVHGAHALHDEAVALAGCSAVLVARHEEARLAQEVRVRAGGIRGGVGGRGAHGAERSQSFLGDGDAGSGEGPLFLEDVPAPQAQQSVGDRVRIAGEVLAGDDAVPVDDEAAEPLRDEDFHGEAPPMRVRDLKGPTAGAPLNDGWLRWASPVADPSPSLAARVGSLPLRNPLLLASGFLDETASSMLRAWREGAGAVVTKSIGVQARLGHANPTLVAVQGGYLNAMGLPNPGMDAFAHEVEAVAKGGATVIGSVFGGTEEEFATLVARMDAAGAHAVELNVSCPHAKGVGTDIGCNPRLLQSVTAAARGATKKPLWVKLSPNVVSVAEMARVAVDAGADALVCVNTLKSIAIDAETRRPILGNRAGGFSGPGLKPVALRAVWDVAQAVDKPVVGVGGIMNATDVVEFLLAGASAVQLGSVLIERDVAAFGELGRDLAAWMAERGVRRLEDLVGAALP
jgi:dihydroorotate dehydrogenase (NAD+) catalytic subunit